MAVLMAITIEKDSETYQEVARNLNLPKDLVKENSRKLLLDTYVDDGTTGGSSEDVNRRLG